MSRPATLENLNSFRMQAERSGEPAAGAGRFMPDYPVFKQHGRTGATRYTPSLRSDKYGRVYVYWYDQIQIREYDEMRLDGQARAGLQLVKLPIRRARWIINCSDPDIAAFVQEVLRPIWPDLIRQILLGLDFGYSVFEKIFTLAYGLRVTQTQGQLDAGKERVYPVALTLKRLLQLDPNTIWLLGYKNSGEFAGVKQYTPWDATIPANKCLHWANEMEFQELYGISRLKACYPYWYFKKLMYEWLNVYYETFSVPMKKGRFPEGRSEAGTDPAGNKIYVDNDDVMLDWLESLRNNHAIALPSSRYEEGSEFLWDVEFMETNRTGADHLAYINHLNLMILKSLLVPQLALETGDSGTYNLAEEQIDFFMEGEEALAEEIAQQINEQLIAQIVKFNFGPNAPKALMQFQPMTKALEEGLREVIMETLGSGQPIPLVDGRQMVPDWQWIADRTGIPVQILTEDEMQSYRAAQDANAPPDMPFGAGPDQMGGMPGGGGQPGRQSQPGGKPGGMPGKPSYGQNAGAGGANTGGDEAALEELLANQSRGIWAVIDGEMVWRGAAA